MNKPTQTTTTAREAITHLQPRFEQLVAAIGQVILGKEQIIRLILCGFFAKGHVLIEDQPGVGKTTLAHVLAKTLGLSFQRIQFTSDLLPADILGVSIYDRNDQQFKFHNGPIFAQMLLADEVNRATPKTQSALLEAMEERQVTVEGETRPLPQPFLVLATQNPMHQIGTFPLPESQLDRFMMRVALGYPDAVAEQALLKGRDRRDLILSLPELLNAAQINEIQQLVWQISVSDALIDYLQALLRHTRDNAEYPNGLSPRAGLAVLHCARAWAMTQGRDFVIPEDIQAVFPSVTSHRLAGASTRHNGTQLAASLLVRVDVP